MTGSYGIFIGAGWKRCYLNLMGNKANNAESEQRVNEVYLLLLSGASRYEIVQYAAKWDIGWRQADNYIAKANARFEESAATVRDRELGKSIQRLNKLYQSLLKIQDYKGALQTQKELNTLLGLHAPSKLEHTGPGGQELTIKVVYEDALADNDDTD